MKTNFARSKLMKGDMSDLREGILVKVEACSIRGNERVWVRVSSLSRDGEKTVIRGKVYSLPILTDYHGLNLDDEVEFTESEILEIGEEHEASDLLLEIDGGETLYYALWDTEPTGVSAP